MNRSDSPPIADPDRSRPVQYWTTTEVAAFLRTSPETVRYWRHINTGPRSFKVGRRVLYDVADVASFIDAARQTGGEH